MRADGRRGSTSAASTRAEGPPNRSGSEGADRSACSASAIELAMRRGHGGAHRWSKDVHLRHLVARGRSAESIRIRGDRSVRLQRFRNRARHAAEVAAARTDGRRASTSAASTRAEGPPNRSGSEGADRSACSSSAIELAMRRGHGGAHRWSKDVHLRHLVARGQSAESIRIRGGRSVRLQRFRNRARHAAEVAAARTDGRRASTSAASTRADGPPNQSGIAGMRRLACKVRAIAHAAAAERCGELEAAGPARLVGRLRAPGGVHRRLEL